MHSMKKKKGIADNAWLETNSVSLVASLQTSAIRLLTYNCTISCMMSFNDFGHTALVLSCLQQPRYVNNVLKTSVVRAWTKTQQDRLNAMRFDDEMNHEALLAYKQTIFTEECTWRAFFSSLAVHTSMASALEICAQL